MGRLSEARKKARAKKGGNDGETPVTPGADAPAPSSAESVVPASVSAPAAPSPEPESAASAPEPDVHQADDEAAWIARALAEAEAEIGGAPAVAEAAEGKSDGRIVLPASGLADDILAAWSAEQDESDTGAGAAVSPAAGEESFSFDDVFDDAAGLQGSVLEALREEAAPGALRSMPSSGLAEDILQYVDAKPAQRSSLSLDEIHEFENFFEDEQQTEFAQYVLFSIGRETFGVDIAHVREIIRAPRITRVPNADRAVTGVFNLRGRIVPLFVLRSLLNLPSRALDRDSRVMVFESGARHVGMLIDGVREVARVDVRDIEPPPEEITSAVDRNLVTAVARYRDRVIFLLDMDSVLGFNRPPMSHAR